LTTLIKVNVDICEVKQTSLLRRHLDGSAFIIDVTKMKNLELLPSTIRASLKCESRAHFRAHHIRRVEGNVEFSNVGSIALPNLVTIEGDLKIGRDIELCTTTPPTAKSDDLRALNVQALKYVQNVSLQGYPNIFLSSLEKMRTLEADSVTRHLGLQGLRQFSSILASASDVYLPQDALGIVLAKNIIRFDPSRSLRPRKFKLQRLSPV